MRRTLPGLELCNQRALNSPGIHAFTEFQQSLPATDSTSVSPPLIGLIQGSIPYSQMPAGYFPWVNCQSLRSILNSKLSIVQRSSLTCIFYIFPRDITQAFYKLTGSNLKQVLHWFCKGKDILCIGMIVESGI